MLHSLKLHVGQPKGILMATIAYIRVSTTDQNTGRQTTSPSVDKTFTDKMTGATKDRPALQEMLSYIRGGDEVVVHSIDRLARNLADLQTIVSQITNVGASVTFLSENLTFKGNDDAMSTLMFQMMGAFAQFERTIIKKRQAEGIAKAKEAGKFKGGVKTIDRAKVKHLLDSGLNISQVARELGVSRPSIYRIQAELVDT